MLSLSIQLARKDFVLAIDKLSLPTEGVTAVFGRSGCGKSTLLRVLAGLEPKAVGRVRFGEDIWQDDHQFVPPQSRRVGVVFQDGSLFPHMTVEQNLQFALDRAVSKQSLVSIAERCCIDHRLTASVPTLSGGEKQRVAIARALLSAPQLLLLDEPLSALDTATKRDILPFLEELKQTLRLPMIYVTHAPEEVERLADRVVFMETGRVVAVHDLQTALSRPDSPLFADEGVSSVLMAQVEQLQAGDGLSRLSLEDVMRDSLTSDPVICSLWLPEISQKGRVRVRVMAKDVSVSLTVPQASSLLNVLPVEIKHIEIEKSSALLTLSISGQVLFSQISLRSLRLLGLQSGMSVYALIKAMSLV